MGAAWGRDAEAVALGTPNEETAFALDYFGVTAPRVVTSAVAEGVDQVILTDHNEFQQSIAIIKGWKWQRLLTTTGWQTLKRPTLSTCAWGTSWPNQPPLSFTELQKEAGITLPRREVAGLSHWSPFLLSAERPLQLHASDPQVATKLAETGCRRKNTVGLSPKRVPTWPAVSEELVDIDAKTFELNGNNVRVAQVNTVDINEVLERQEEIEAALSEAIVTEGYSDFVLMITDIVNSNSEILAMTCFLGLKVGFHANFKLKTTIPSWRERTLTIKKQVVPQLTESFNQQ